MFGETLASANSSRTKLVAALLASTALFGCSGSSSPEKVQHKPTISPSESTSNDFRGGCDTFRVYAQNRWDPVGTAVREKPDVLSTKEEPGFSPNEVIAVDGWITTGEPVYPTNPAPWNSDVWFHLANRDGWVSFAGVRGEPTTYDTTGQSDDGGQPAATTDECKGMYQSSLS